VRCGDRTRFNMERSALPSPCSVVLPLSVPFQSFKTVSRRYQQVCQLGGVVFQEETTVSRDYCRPSPFRFRANAAASSRSPASGLPLFKPPKYLRKLFVLNPTQLNSPATV